MPLTKDTLLWVEKELNSKVKRAQPLLGGTSSLLWLVTVDAGRKVVLREYTDIKWLALEPEIARQEAENLRAAAPLTIHTSKLLAVDSYGEVTTHPTVVMSHIAGKVTLQPDDRRTWLDELAQTLARLHTSKAVVTNKYFRYFDPADDVTADWSRHPKGYKQALAYLNSTARPKTKETFIHRDFHPTNVLFLDTTVSGVVDWTDACMGPREIDVAHCRWNLAMLDGVDTADAFLKAYLTHSGLDTYAPYWDLEALMNVFSKEPPEVYAGWEAFGRVELTPLLMRDRMDAFLTQALTKVSN